ncbi:MAG: iron transporter, partial [Planctomycetota bacterium]
MKIETVACLGLMMLLVGCVPSSPREVVVYCALDKEFSQPILDEFQAKTGIKVLPKFDQESNKTVGLAEEILQQSENQRCDVFWNNEILHTLRLKKAGLLVPFSAKESSEYASQFVSRESDWYGFAARARVILVNTEQLRAPKDYPDS